MDKPIEGLLHQHFPRRNWGLGKGLNQQMPTNREGGLGFQKHRELWTEPRVRDLSSRWNYVPPQADLPWTGKPMRLGVQSKDNRAQNLSTALGNDKKYGTLKEFTGIMPVFLVVPKAIGSFLRIPSLPPNKIHLSRF